MFVTYGTKRYYEFELEKANFAEIAVKNEVEESLRRETGCPSAHTLYLYAEVLAMVEKNVRLAQQGLKEFLAKEKKENDV